jgi:hypothetical protein
VDKGRRKELQEQYKARKITGGIFRILNRENDRFYLRSTDDMHSTREGFQKWKDFHTCSHPSLVKDWQRCGADAFRLEELDLLEKGDSQTREEFAADLKALLELWDEKLPKDNRY